MILRWLIILVFVPTLAWGAIAEVGGGTQRATKAKQTSNSTTLAYPGNVTAGSLLFGGGVMWNGGGPPASATITDTIFTPYTKVYCAAVDTNSVPFFFYGIAPSSAANTVTVDPVNASDTFNWAQDEFSGVNTSTPLDVDGGSTTSTGTTASDTILTVTANDLVVGLVGSPSADGHTVGAGYTRIGNDTSSITGMDLEFQVVTTATTYTVDFTSVDGNWTVCTLAFKVPGAASTRRPVSPMVLP